MVLVAPGVLSVWMVRNQGPTRSSPVLAGLRLSVFGPDSKVLIALAVASQGAGENAGGGKKGGDQAVPDGQVSSHLSSSLCGAVDRPLKALVFQHWCFRSAAWPPVAPLNLECTLTFALALLAASEHASLVSTHL